MTENVWWKRLPGYLATGIVIVVSGFWFFWGVAEMYYEGWWGAWTNRLPYLIPGVVCILLTLAAITWPRIGGWLLVIVGSGFSIWWFGEDLIEGTFTMRRLVQQVPMSASLAVVGALFLLEARNKRKRLAAGWQPHERWWRRNLAYLLTLGSALLIFIGTSIYNLPMVLTRQDDGDRGARLIDGNGITLVWAPEGPGWNWQQSFGGYPSWGALALYGARPIGIDTKPIEEKRAATQEDMDTTGLCAYLNDAGTELLDLPQYIWRMPTTDEMVRSLALHGENAGCAWNGEKGFMECELTPDKETPLWAPDLNPIYYWTGDEFDVEEAYFVSYNGAVNYQPKGWGNPRHGYRCVKEP